MSKRLRLARTDAIGLLNSGGSISVAISVSFGRSVGITEGTRVRPIVTKDTVGFEVCDSMEGPVLRLKGKALRCELQMDSASSFCRDGATRKVSRRDIARDHSGGSTAFLFDRLSDGKPLTINIDSVARASSEKIESVLNSSGDARLNLSASEIRARAVIRLAGIMVAHGVCPRCGCDSTTGSMCWDCGLAITKEEISQAIKDTKRSMDVDLNLLKEFKSKVKQKKA